MAKVVQLNTYITKAIYSGYFFTKTDDKKDKTINENKNVSDKTWNSRFDVIDSPNNVDGLIIASNGIYVVRRFKPLQFDSKTGSWESTIQTPVYQDRQNNKDFSKELKYCNQVSIAREWAKNPTIQNIRYIIIETEVFNAINGNTGYNISTEARLRTFLDGMRDRKQFPLLTKICSVPTLWLILSSQESKSNPDGALNWLNKIVRNNRGKNQQYPGDDCLALTKAFEDRANILDPQNAPFSTGVQLINNEIGFAPAKPETERIIRADVYKFDKLCLQKIKETEQAKQKAAEAEQKNEAKADGNRPGLTQLRKIKNKMSGEYTLDACVEQNIKNICESYNYAFAQAYDPGQISNIGILRQSGAIRLHSSRNDILADNQVEYVQAYEKIKSNFQSIDTLKNAFIAIKQRELIDNAFDKMDALAELVDKCMTNGVVFNDCVQIRFVKQYKRDTINLIPEQFFDDKDTYNKIKQQTQIKITSTEDFKAVVHYFIKTLAWYVAYDKLIANENIKSIIDNGVKSDNDVDIILGNMKQTLNDFKKSLGYVIQVSIEQNEEDPDKNGQPNAIIYRVVYPGYADVKDIMINSIKNQYAGECDVQEIQSKQDIGDNRYKFGIRVNKKERSLLAVKVLQSLAESGQRIQFDNVLLGEDAEGSLVKYSDFCSSSNDQSNYRSYALYAGTGAGKGIMTNNLLAHAIASNIKIAYFDGKPDTGQTLGNLAWRRRKEALVFDGAYQGDAKYAAGYLEDYANGLRQNDERFADVSRIPGELRDKLNDVNLNNLLNATRYLRCLQLSYYIMKSRAMQHDKDNSKDDFFFMVFDECTVMARVEHDVRECLGGIQKDLEKGKKKGTPDTEGIQYIKKWFAWQEELKTNYIQVQKVQLRSSNVVLLFIFQEASWLGDGSEKLYGGTIYEILRQMNLGKFIGKGGTGKGSYGQYGSGKVANQPWVSELNKNGGWAEVIKDPQVDSYVSGKVPTIVYPYKLFGNSRKELLSLNDNPDQDMEKMCIDDQSFHGSMQYFVHKLEEMTKNSQNPVNAAETLEQSYIYAENIVKQFGYQQLKQFVYQLDCSMQQFNPGAKIDKGFVPGQVSQAQGQASTQAVGDVTRDATSKEKKSTGSTQPGSVRLTGATEEERLQQAMFMGVDTTNMRAPSAEYTDARRQTQTQQQNQYRQNPFARTATDRAIQQDMTTGDPDIQQAQQGYFSEDQDGNTVVGDQNYGEGGELLTKDNYIPASKRAKSYGGALWQSFTMFVGRNQPFTRRGAIMRARYAVTINGLLINEIENSVGGWGYVKTLVFSQTKIMVNGKRLNPHDYLQDEWGNIDLQLAINAGKIISRFRNLQSLQFDDDAYYKFFDQLDKFGDDRIKHVFNKLKQLRALCNITTGVVISRHEGLSQTYSEQVDQLAKKGIEQKAKDAKYKEAQEGIIKKGFHYTFGRGVGTNIVQMAQLGIGFFIGGPIIGLTALMMQRKAMKKVYGQPQNGNTNRRNNNNNNTYRPMLG